MGGLSREEGRERKKRKGKGRGAETWEPATPEAQRRGPGSGSTFSPKALSPLSSPLAEGGISAEPPALT